MVKIRIDTERVRDVGSRLSSESDHLEQINYELQQAIGSLDTGAWDGHSRAKAEPMLDQVHPNCRRVSDELDRFGQTLKRVAEVFEDKDANVVEHGLSIGIWPVRPKLPPGFRLPDWLVPGPPPWDWWRLLPWPPRYWPWLPIIPILPILPPGFRPPWNWPRPGIPNPRLPLPKPLPKPKPKPMPMPQPKPPSPKPSPEVPPKPITKPVCPLHPTDDSRSCVWYARGRRPDLGAAGGSAEDYIDKYKSSAYQLDDSQIQAPLQSSNVRPGHAIVWKAGFKGANKTHGHVGIVEEVHADCIIISEANWGGPGIKKRKISKNDLQGLYFVP